MTEHGKPNPDLNINENLEQEFNLNHTEETSNKETDIIDKMRNQLISANIGEDPDTILSENIGRANTLLDKAQDVINGGGSPSPRMFEVCAQLINAITSAATSIQNSTFGHQKHEFNMKTIEVKEKEVAVKNALALNKIEKQDKSRDNNSKNVVVMSREELLNMIAKEESEVEIESIGKKPTEK